MPEEHQGSEVDLIEAGGEVPADDRALAEQAFPEWRVLFSESFMWVYRDSYPLEWASREVVQNWVDENPNDPGTLNGVTRKMEPTPNAPSGTRTFTMTGPWAFNPAGTPRP